MSISKFRKSVLFVLIIHFTESSDIHCISKKMSFNSLNQFLRDLSCAQKETTVWKISKCHLYFSVLLFSEGNTLSSVVFFRPSAPFQRFFSSTKISPVALRYLFLSYSRNL